jgi:hypothetical protein
MKGILQEGYIRGKNDRGRKGRKRNSRVDRGEETEDRRQWTGRRRHEERRQKTVDSDRPASPHGKKTGDRRQRTGRRHREEKRV